MYVSHESLDLCSVFKCAMYSGWKLKHRDMFARES